MGLSAGTMLGSYEVLAPLGAGGMGEVYRARDTRLGRDVAVKIVAGHSVGDAAALARFEQEARTVAALSHPNILAIHDVGSADGLAFAVMELLEGETLRERLAAGRLPVPEAVDLGTQIALGLAAAHAKGVVHRDIKPDNLFVTPGGHLKILDFGLARPPRSSGGEPKSQEATGRLLETGAGVVLGTLAYLSPEQARGEPADPRSDIFGLGIVLYEMLSGSHPFTRPSAAETIAAILKDEPPVVEPTAGVPPALERLARRCLQKRPSERFQMACDVAFALEAYADARPSSRASRPQRERDGTSRTSVAVLPFRDLARDPANAYFGLGLADATITELSLVRSLLVRPTASTMRFADRPIDPRDAGRELDVDAVVDGTFQRSGSKLRVTVQVVETREGRTLWGTKIDTSLDDLFAVQDDVSRRIVEALEVRLSPADERQLARGPRTAGHAWDLYVKGRFHMLREGLEEVNTAIECFEKAKALDSGFAPAYAGLANAFVVMAYTYEPDGDWYERADAMCGEALRLDPALPEARYVRARLLWSPHAGFDHAGALRELTAALAGRPSLNEAHTRIGVVLVHVGLLDEAERSFRRGLARSPDDPGAAIHLALAHYYAGRVREALEATDASLKSAPSPWAHYQLGLCHARLGQLDRAAEVAEVAARLYPGDVLSHGLRGLVAACRMEEAKALQEVQSVVRNKRAFGHYHHALHDVAGIHALLGNVGDALTCLEEAARNGFPCLDAYENDPFLERLRSERRYLSLVAWLREERDRHRSLYAGLSGSDSA